MVKFLYCFLLFGIFSTHSEAQENDTAVSQRYEDKFPRLAAILSEFIEDNRVAGLSIAIAINGRRVLSDGFGFADVEQKIESNGQTMYRIGSVSKLLTAITLLKTMEEGYISLDSSLYKYVPEFPRKKDDFTIRQLARHLAGIRHYKSKSEVLNRQHFLNLTQGLVLFQDDDLIDRPGKFHYSSYGYNLLSVAIERATGKSLQTCIHEYIVNPLDLKYTCPDICDSMIINRSHFYRYFSSKGAMSQENVHVCYKWGSGGYLSSVEDLVKLGMSLLSDTMFIRGDARSEFFDPLFAHNGRDVMYGIGAKCAIEKDLGKVIYHNGAVAGGTAMFFMVPDKQFVMGMATNTTDALIKRSLAVEIAKLFLRK